MTSDLQDQIYTRLTESGDGDEPWAMVVLAALEGDATLAAYLDGNATVAPATAPETTDAASSAEPPGVFLSSITVSGFRGIGPTASLQLRPGPGLTLVVGRNGSGKSSFAEALEFLLTDRNYRWENRSKAWIDGWRNLHTSDACAVKAELVVEGKGPLTVSRTWSGAAVGDGETTVSATGERARDFASLGWKHALETFRPFLSYNELGSLLEDGPSKLYDALSSVLGLDELVRVQNALASARKARQQHFDDATQGAKAIIDRIGVLLPSDDARFDATARALRGNDWDLDALGDLVAGDGASEDSAVGLLRRIAELALPDVDAISRAVEHLREADAACAEFEGSDAERARRRADLLSAALGFHQSHDGTDCPVCGTANVLSTAWRDATTQEIAALRSEAGAVEAAASARTAAARDAQRLVTAPSPLLTQAADLGLVALADASQTWGVWAQARDITSAGELAHHLEDHALGFSEALAALVAEAQMEVQRREDLWRPIATAVAEWIAVGRKGKRAKAALTEIKAAEAWWKTTSESIRNERFEPIASRAMATWKTLRLQSNVDLDGVDLEGTGQRRKVALRVTVDGTPAEAVGVMSQGELHALALSLFLPRATLSESPFRFIAIDDPVQSMDPSRVDGLARVLADAAKTRQVLVFTHDDRLPEAVRRLGIEATVFRVTRHDRSVVDVHTADDPVFAYLDDARAVVKTGALPADVVSRVVPGFCRSAVEAACMETIRRRRLGKGESYDAVEQLLATNARTHPLMALALFDDEQRAADVFATLNKRVGVWASDIFRACKEGAHDAHGGDLAVLVDRTGRLAEFVRTLS